ncbi:conserved hypothetical protein [Theileria orientalis strain Shintoku]|uniref:Uncharacterized protein n=1 Tax=Theileria orientalis strain Shintoku TaxID=869250 RepID=J4D6N3_THEOR|nr:conserved hypothetical protein [Theileria orientalis strain Shintoku]PVC52463.1 hypothetical protein MACL_00000759 [Theileria orientalis]BAM39685.1 conserved hypothetical protein [Theileria orientalis strain Shintoku]|eukprot:XP_009689986.1 conserved hypothetical protein [Theileria orientalis strain Shintoku]
MRFSVVSVAICLHIVTLVESVDEDTESDSFQERNSEDKELDHLGLLNLLDVENITKLSSKNYEQKLIATEFSFIVNLGVKVEGILQSYQKLIEENLEEAYDEIENEMDPLMYDFGVKLKEYLDILNLKLEEMEEQGEEYESKVEEPRSFLNTKSIKESLEMVKKVYNIVNEKIVISCVDKEVKRNLLWTVKNKMVLFSLGVKIIFLKMVNNYARACKIRERFSETGINYLMVFDRGINERIKDPKKEGRIIYFNSFIENYESATEELIQRVISQIKENELMLKLKEKTHKNFEMMHRDLEEQIKPILGLSGAVMKNVRI